MLPHLGAFAARVASRPHLAAYLTSPRRMPRYGRDARTGEGVYVYIPGAHAPPALLALDLDSASLDLGEPYHVEDGDGRLHAEGGGRLRLEGGRSLFYKRTLFLHSHDGEEEDQAFGAYRIVKRRTLVAQSHLTEVGFLRSRACTLLQDSGAHVARALAADVRPGRGVSMVLEDFSPDAGWRQHWLLDAHAARASLGALARLHAFFWAGSDFWGRTDAADELETSVWPCGGYAQPSMQPDSLPASVASEWRKHCAGALGSVLTAAVEDVASFGERLQRAAPRAAAAAHPFDAHAGGDAAAHAHMRTLIHGDPKAANVLVRGDEAGWIDWQWVGFGLAATDVAHHLCSAVRAEALAGAGESQLLDHYHTELCRRLEEAGVAAERWLSRDALQRQYEMAIVDMCRLVVANQFGRYEAKTRAMAKNAYNKVAASAAWLVGRCDQVLQGMEAPTISDAAAASSSFV